MKPTSTLYAILLAGGALLANGSLWAHGYVTRPEARGLLCKMGENSNCGAIQWEPQSLEGPSGYPVQGPADEVLASAGLAQFSELNEQTSSRWTKRAMQAGAFTFEWQFTANHATRHWRYFITKADWNPNQKLSRAAFEPAPFCTVDGELKQPPAHVSHNCTVPQRSGYQVILAVWQIGDTTNSFYNVIDVLFKDGGTPPPVWSQAGTIFPSVDLNAGDSVASRVFDAAGERPELQTKLSIGSPTEGQRNNWAYQLASRINAEQPLLRAGQMDQAGAINPAYGQNTIYAKAGSQLTRVEVQINKDQTPPPDFSVGDLQTSYAISNGQASIGFSVAASGDMEVSAYVYDQAGVAKGYAAASMSGNSLPFAIALNQPKAGPHQLVVKATLKDGTVLQKTLALTLSDAGQTAYDYVFPASVSSYKAGSRVLQPKDGKVYTCKPFPYSGYCIQWAPTATQYEPGVGSNWKDAWTAP